MGKTQNFEFSSASIDGIVLLCLCSYITLLAWALVLSIIGQSTGSLYLQFFH